MAPLKKTNLSYEDIIETQNSTDLPDMLNVFESHLLDDVVSRVEQSRFESNFQAEEFRHLNTNFQTYLTDIKQIDDENSQLQKDIEQIRTAYIRTLENHLKRLPEDFRQESQVLTEAHLERYKSKSRAKRFINEREEMKKRINFVGNNEKEQLKRLNHLQRQERTVQNEIKSLHDQYRNVVNYVEREKNLHRQAMEKIDQLQIQLEQVSIERSKTEFEVQNLREEVKLMQTAKEFLDEEYETILAAQEEANDYFLSCLNESILRIRDDFDDLNQRQLEQMESEYEQMMKVAEENSLASVSVSEAGINRQRAAQAECDKLQDEQQSVTQELNTLSEHNQTLSERILAMEADLLALRADRLRESLHKDNELQQSKMELETLNEQLARLTEYDRNLKFELTLYRGVLESEYRRKQQQSSNAQPPARPTILRTTLNRHNRTFPILSNHKQVELNGEKEENEVEPSSLTTADLDDRGDSEGEENFAPEQKTLEDEHQPEQTLKSSSEILTPSTDPEVETVENTLPSDQANEITDGPGLFGMVTYLTSALYEDDKEPSNADQASSPTPETEQFTVATELDNQSSPSDEVQQLSSTSINDQETSEDRQKLSFAPPSTNETSPIPAAAEDQQDVNEAPQSPTVPQDYVPSSPVYEQPSPTSIASTFPAAQIEETLELGEAHKSFATSTDEQPLSETEELQMPSFDTAPPTEPSTLSETHLSSATQPEKQDQKSAAPSPLEEQAPRAISPSPATPIETATPDEPSFSDDAQRQANGSQSTHDDPIDLPLHKESLFTASQEQSPSSEYQQFPTVDDTTQEPASSMVTEEQPLLSAGGDFDDDNPHAKSSDGYDNDFESEEETKSSSLGTDDSGKYAVRHPIYSIPEQEINPTEKEETSSFNSSGTSSDQTQETVPASGDTEPIAEQDVTTAEEKASSSDYNQREEEDSEIGHTSSSGYYGTANSYTQILSQQLDEPTSSRASLTDVGDDNTAALGEVDRPTSPKLEEKNPNDANEPNLEAVMQDLRYVYRDLANDEDLVNIDEDFPDYLTDRLEFGDQLIRTLFENFITQYLVQTAASGARSKTLDWIEFRDILFPILTGRYMERHIRKLFDLFDTSKDGYLSFQEIVELFELLQVSNSAELALYMMHEFDKNNDRKLSVDEFISAVKKTDDVKSNLLPEHLEDQSWFTQHPFDDEANDSRSISLEVPVIGFSAKPNVNSTESIHTQITLLGRIFKRIGANAENKEVDSTQPTLAMKLTNEFINNNIHISNEDLYRFIDMYLTKKQHSSSSESIDFASHTRGSSDRFITWEEFRDLFLPFVHGGMLTKEDMSRWFAVLDTNQSRTIDREQVLHLLRLLQFAQPEEILEKMNEVSETYTNNNDSWTLEELLFAFDNTDETTTRLYMSNEQIKSFDRQWLIENVF